jgi:hypothetical protein
MLNVQEQLHETCQEVRFIGFAYQALSNVPPSVQSFGDGCLPLLMHIKCTSNSHYRPFNLYAPPSGGGRPGFDLYLIEREAFRLIDTGVNAKLNLTTQTSSSVLQSPHGLRHYAKQSSLPSTQCSQ